MCVYINLLKIWGEMWWMTEGEWMGDRWSMMLSLKKKKKKKKKKMFPFLLFIYFLSRSFIVRRRGEKRKERKEKREAKVILSTWNKSTWFLLPFFCFIFTTHIYIYISKQKKATRKLILYTKRNFRFCFRILLYT